MLSSGSGDVPLMMRYRDIYRTSYAMEAFYTYVGFHAALPVKKSFVFFEAGDEGFCRGDGGVGREAAEGARSRQRRKILEEAVEF